MLGFPMQLVVTAMIILARVDALSILNDRRPKALYFSGAGTYFFWQCGAAKYLQESCAYEEIPIIGASAGSLTGLLLLAGVDMDQAVNVALERAEGSQIFDKKSGLRGELNSLLSQWLDEVIPRELPMEALSQLSIALTPPPMNPLNLEPPTLMRDFVSREDVLSACLASCHIPFFSSGKLTAQYKDTPYIDGSFYYWVTKNRFSGLPLPDCDPDDVLWIDYCDDEVFMKQIQDKSFLDVHDATAVKGMVDSGYKYLQIAHSEGRLPLAVTPKPINVPSASVMKSPKPTVSRLEKELRQWKRENHTPCGRVGAPHVTVHQAGLSGGISDLTLWPSQHPVDEA